MEEDSIDSLIQLVLPLCLVPSPPVNVSAVLSVDLSTNVSTLNSADTLTGGDGTRQRGRTS